MHFSPDSSEILALTEDTLWRYDVKTRRAKQVHPLLPLTKLKHRSRHPAPSKTGRGDSISFGQPVLSPDGRFLAGWDGNIVIFDARTGGVVRRISVPQVSKLDFDFVPVGGDFKARWTGDGKRLYVHGPGWKGTLIFSWPGGRKIGTSPRAVSEEDDIPDTGQHLVPSPDHRFLAAPRQKDIVLLDEVTGKIVRRARGAASAIGNGLFDVAVSPSGDAIYFQPTIRQGSRQIVSNSIVRWPTLPE